MFKFQPLILALLTMVLLSCGAPKKKPRTTSTIAESTEWKTVVMAVVRIGNPNLGLAPITTNITYAFPELDIFGLDTSGLAANLIDEDNLSLGNIKVNRLLMNKLRVCGPSGDIKCNRSAIRAYTISGFKHNTTMNTLPVRMDTKLIGEMESNATMLDSYNIANTDWILSRRDFVDLDYDINVDVSNAGYGGYEMDLVLEVALGYE